MLILVGVTINVALNGGLFEQATKAKTETQLAADKEELQLEIITAYNEKTGEVNLSTLKTNLEAKRWKVTISGDKAICTSPKGNTFTVDKEGKITEGGTHPGGGNEPSAFDWSSVGLTVDTNTEYIADGAISLTFSTDGKLTEFFDGMELLTIDATDSKYITNGKIDFTEGTEEILGEKGRIKVEMNGNKRDIDLTFICFEEDGITEQEPEVSTCVKVVLDSKNVYSNAEVLQALGATGGTYKGTWTVIERDASGNPTKLVSTSDVAYCELGESNNLEKSISDYKNAESILDTVAKTATGIAIARSVNIGDIESLAGIQDSEKGTEYLKEYKYNYTNHKDQVFVNDKGETVKIDSEGKEVTLTRTYYDYDLTDDQKAEIGALASGYYWLASPCVDCYSGNAYFIVRYMLNGYIYSGYLFDSNGNADCRGSGVRAVVSVSGL